MNILKVVNRYVFDVPEKDAFKQKIGDKEIYFDASLGSEHDNMVQYGTLVAKPKSAKFDIKEGELVYFSHLARNYQARIQIKDKVYYSVDQKFCEGIGSLYQLILCTNKRAVGDVTIVERIEEPEENYKSGAIFLKTKPDNLKNQFKVVKSNKIKAGTEIIISEDADYDFLDENKKELIAVQDQHIMATIDKGELVPYGDYAIIEPLDDQEKEDFVEKNGVFIPKDKALRGWGRWKDSRVYYHKVQSNNFEYKKKKYSGCIKQDIYYICENE